MMGIEIKMSSIGNGNTAREWEGMGSTKITAITSKLFKPS